MARTHYNNGDEISLACGCDGCNPAMINGLLCHEAGCPEAWRDHEVACFECGCDFSPEQAHQTICQDCVRNAEWDEEVGADEDEDDPDDDDADLGECDDCGAALERCCDGIARCLECAPCPACHDGGGPGGDDEDEDEEDDDLGDCAGCGDPLERRPDGVVYCPYCASYDEG